MPAAHANDFDRIAMVDVQPHYFGGEMDRGDLVINHHPEQSGYTVLVPGSVGRRHAHPQDGGKS
jgi:hypothetical protein